MASNHRNTILVVFTRTVVCLLLLGVALAMYTVLWRTRPLPNAAQIATAPSVLVFPARSVPVRRQWTGFGTAEPMDSADVPARVVATVVEIPPEVLAGAVVEKDRLLVRLDDSDFARQVEISTQTIADLDAQLSRLVVEKQSWTSRLELAQEEVQLAKDELERVRKALERDVAKQREVDQARVALIQVATAEITAKEELDKIEPRRLALEAQKAGQEAAKKLAEFNVTRCEITSPLAGILQSVDVETGENLASGQRVARVVSLRRIEVALRLPAGARSDVAVGDEVVLASTGSRRRIWPATVHRVAPEDDESTRTVAVYVEVEQDPSDADLLAPGMFLKGTVTSRTESTRWVVPRRSVKGGRVTVVRDGVLASRAVEVDFHLEARLDAFDVADTQWLVLKTTLREGEPVLLNASRALADGSKVTAVPVRPAMAGRGSATAGGGS